MSLDTCVVHIIICKTCKGVDQIVLVLIDYCMFKQLNYLCTIFDIECQWGEVWHEKNSIMGEKCCKDLHEARFD